MIGIRQIRELVQNQRIEALEARVRQLEAEAHYHLPPLQPPSYGQLPYFVPPPCLHYAGAPAGRGLTKAPTGQGWPENSFRTAGGYTVVFDGTQTSMKIYKPGQGPDDKPMTKVWGDPHVHESDGTKWDFTKDGDMILPDGTLISMDTTAQRGQSFLQNVTIVSGGERVDVSGIDKNRPSAGFIRGDGYAWRAHHAALKAGTDRHTYVLGSRPGEDVTWNLFVRGVDQGEINGADYKNDQYIPRTDGSRLFRPDPRLRPPLGSAAWAHLINAWAADNLPHLHGGFAPGFAESHAALAQLAQLAQLGQGAQAGLGAAHPIGFIPGGGGNHALQNSNPLKEAFFSADLERILADPNLSVEDMVMLVLMRVMDKFDEDIKQQTKHLARLQNQQKKKGKKGGGLGGGFGGLMKTAGSVVGGIYGGPAGAAAGGMAGGMVGNAFNGGGRGGGSAADTSVDTEALKLQRMVSKRSNLFEALRGIITKYDETAKQTAQSIGR